MKKSGSTEPLLVLGLGNVLCGDDGLGVAAIGLLSRQFRIPERVRVLDGGTLGLSLLSHIRASEDVILVDAICGAGPPGTFIRIEGDEVGPAVRTRLSCHQIGVADLLSVLDILDAYPRRLILLGLIPETLKLGLGCSPPVKSQLPELVGKIVEEAGRLGYELVPSPRDKADSSENTSRAARALGL
jgi:hydrogenase maturation protease